MESDVLRWSLLVIGGVIIVGVAVHGIWVSRKNTDTKTKNSAAEQEVEQELQPQGWQTDEDDIGSDSIDDIPNINVDVNIDTGMNEDNFSAEQHTPITSAEQFDELGIGEVRVVSSDKGLTVENTEPPLQSEPQTQNDLKSTETQSKVSLPQSEPQEQSEQAKATSLPDKDAGKIYASVVTQPKPEYAESLAAQTVAISKEEKVQTTTQQEPAFNISQVSNSDLNPGRSSMSNSIVGQDRYEAPEPPPFLLKKEDDRTVKVGIPESNKQGASESTHNKEQQLESESQQQVVQQETEQKSTSIKESLTEQARNLVKRKKAEAGRRKREPKIAEDQMRIDFDEEPTESITAEIKPEPEAPQEQQQEVLVLNVKVADDSPIPGSALLPMLLTLGFKFGDQDIFHRHVNSNGKGPVLFSLANMFKPGNFDIDNLENFTTQGVSLFMILPIEGEPHQVFNMMHNAARKIAEEFSAQIYDARRTLLTKQSLQQYVEKIREFERQRMLKR
jgi:cell division protein ZipA